jgi:trimeric autotransporter adhesin
MKTKLHSLTIVLLVLSISSVYGQGVGIGATSFTPASDAILELRSSTSGFLMPRMTQAQRLAIASPSNGLLVYQTDGTSGFYYYSGGVWKSFGADDLGNHSAAATLVLNDNVIANTSGGEGIRISNVGNVGVGPVVGAPSSRLQVASGDVRISSAGGTAYGVRLENPAGTFTSTIKAGAQTSNITYTLPTSAPSTDQVLRTDASGNLSWIDRSSGWSLTGNASTNPATNYLGTTDAQPMRIGTSGAERIRINATATEVGIGMTAGANNTLDITNGTTGGRGVNITANALTIGSGMSISANALTSGNGISVSSSSVGFNSTAGLANFTLSGNNAANTGPVLKVVNSGTNNTGAAMMVTNAGNSLALRVNDEGSDADATPFVVDANGQVGVGTAAPSEKLEVTGNVLLSRGADRVIAVQSAITSPQNGGALTINAASAFNGGIASSGGNLLLVAGEGNTLMPGHKGGDVIIRSGANFKNMASGGDIVLQTGGANSTINERMRISQSGNVGIGNAAPTQRLQVTDGNIELQRTGVTAGELRFQGTAAGVTSFKAGAQGATNITYTLPITAPSNNQMLSSDASGVLSWRTGTQWNITGNSGTTASTAAIGSTVNNNFIGTTDNQAFVLATNNFERLRIAADGNVGIGTNVPSRKFHVVGGDNSSSVDAATTNILAFLENTTNNGSAVFNIQAKTSTNTFASRLGINPTYNVGGVGPGVYAWYAGINGTNKQLLMYDFINFNLHLAPSAGTINNVGIGLGQPTLGSKLTINGNLAISNGTGSYTTTAAPDGGAIIEGNVGIGTTSPGQKLQVADGNIRLSRTGGTAGELQFQGTSTGVTSFKAGAQGATNINYTWPTAAPTAGQVLSSDASGNLSWTSGSGSGWALTGNSGTNPATNFVGTTDNQPLRIRVNNQVSGNITSGGAVSLGYQAGAANLNADFTAIGYQALQSNTTGDHNTAVGYLAMQANTTGSHNSAFGKNALEDNTTGDNNTALGEHTLEKNTTGSDNMAAGRSALKKLTTGSDNSGAGTESLSDLTTGSGNSALGYTAGGGITTGSNNTFVGFGASSSNGTLTNATAIGYNASVSTSNSLVLGGTGANAVNVGIGTNAPVATLDVNGTLATRRNNVTCANGANNNLNVGAFSFIKISGPTGAFSITGITGGVDGRIVTLFNSTSHAMTITNDATSTVANRILTLTGAGIVTSGTGSVTLQYDSQSSRWIVIASQL